MAMRTSTVFPTGRTPGRAPSRTPSRMRSSIREPVIFSSPLFTDRKGHMENFSRVAFETDMPRIEFGTTPPCQRHLSNPADPNPGHGLRQPAQGRGLLSVLQHAAGCDERHHETGTRERGSRAGITRNAGGSGRPVHPRNVWTISAEARRRSSGPFWRASIQRRMVSRNISTRTFTGRCRSTRVRRSERRVAGSELTIGKPERAVTRPFCCAGGSTGLPGTIRCSPTGYRPQRTGGAPAAGVDPKPAVAILVAESGYKRSAMRRLLFGLAVLTVRAESCGGRCR